MFKKRVYIYNAESNLLNMYTIYYESNLIISIY